MKVIMQNKRPEKIIEEEQMSVPMPDNYDDIDLDEILGGKEYTPAINSSLGNSFVDMANIQKYKPAQQTNPKKVIQESFNSIRKEPDYSNAGSKLNEMNSVLSQLGNIIGDGKAPNQGRPSNAPTMQQTVQQQQRPPIDITIIHMRKTLEALRNINAWIPESKKEYVNKLGATAAPIIKALDAYVSLIEKMK
jgi:hypothetical protein